MNKKDEFIKKYPPNYYKGVIMAGDILINAIMKSDLNEVLKDEIEKFAEFINGDTISHLFDEITNGDIESYLTKSYETER